MDKEYYSILFSKIIRPLKLRFSMIPFAIWSYLKSIPLKFKFLYSLSFLFFIYLWGLAVQIVIAFLQGNVYGINILPDKCFFGIFSNGFRNSLAGILFPLGLGIIFFAWYIKHHLHDYEWEPIYRDSYVIRKVINDGTLATGGEAKLKDLKEAYTITATPEEYSTPIYGKNYFNGQYVLGPALKPDDPKNTLAIGTVGSRKSRGWIMPMAVQLSKAGENMVFMDPAGELYANLYYFLWLQGYDIKVLNTRNPKFSNWWNFIGDIGEDFQLAHTFARTIIETTSAAQAKTDAFWDGQMTNLLTALILYVNHKGGKISSIRGIVNLITENAEYGPDGKARYKASDKLRKEILGKNGLPKTSPGHRCFQVFWNGENFRDTTMNNLGERLIPFFGNEISDMLSKDDIHVLDFLKPKSEKKTALFIITSEQDDTYAMIGGLLLEASCKILTEVISNSTMQTLPNPLNFLLDEFANIGHIYNINKKFSVSRKYGIAIHVILQYYSQLSDQYTESEIDGIVSNCRNLLMLSANDITTAQFFSENCGEMPVITYQKTTDNPLTNRTATERVTPQARAVYLPDEIQNSKIIGKNDYLLKSIDCRVAKLKKIDISELHEMKELYKAFGNNPEAALHSVAEHYGETKSPLYKAFVKKYKNVRKKNQMREKSRQKENELNIYASLFYNKFKDSSYTTVENEFDIDENGSISFKTDYYDLMSDDVTENDYVEQVIDETSYDEEIEQEVADFSEYDDKFEYTDNINSASAACTTDSKVAEESKEIIVNKKTPQKRSRPINLPVTKPSKKSADGNINTRYSQSISTSLYNRDGTAKYANNRLELNKNRQNTDTQLSLELDNQNESINIIPDIPKNINWDVIMSIYSKFIVKDKTGARRTFCSDDYPQLKGKAVYVLSYMSNAKFIQLPKDQIRAEGEEIDINAITNTLISRIELPKEYCIDYWTKIERRKGKESAKRVSINQIFNMPKANIVLIPHFALKTKIENTPYCH